MDEELKKELLLKAFQMRFKYPQKELVDYIHTSPSPEKKLEIIEETVVAVLNGKSLPRKEDSVEEIYQEKIKEHLIINMIRIMMMCSKRV